jgi:phenylalanyl-tRNA synthetase beta chain
VSWLRALVPGLTASADELAAALVRAGLEVEQVHRYGDDVSGVVTGQVLDVEELTGFKKPIRYCHVDVGARVHEVVCGATNFAAGDRVAFALPGALLPGGFAIATRQTYGHTSDGMICSGAELGLSDESDGILVLPADTPLGVDAVELLQLRDEVLDIAVTPDRGYQLSVRGVAREAATAFELALADPGLAEAPAPSEGGYPVEVAAPDGCDRYVARVVTGFDPAAESPAWLQRRLVLAGMRPISLAVDITNAVMLEVGQPLHAFDLDALSGPVVVRRAQRGSGSPRWTARTASWTRRTCSSPTAAVRSRWPASWAAARPRSPLAPRRSCWRARTSRRCPSPAPPGGTGCRPRRAAGTSAVSTRCWRPPPPSWPCG